MVYFAGRNNGVAEELTLKTNEITHKKSDLPGRHLCRARHRRGHDAEEVVLVIDPFPAEIEKFKTTLVDGVGMTVIAVAAEETILPTIRIPASRATRAILQLLAGWNILVQVGVGLGINLDKAERARKIGNEFIAVSQGDQSHVGHDPILPAARTGGLSDRLHRRRASFSTTGEARRRTLAVRLAARRRRRRWAAA